MAKVTKDQLRSDNEIYRGLAIQRLEELGDCRIENRRLLAENARLKTDLAGYDALKAVIHAQVKTAEATRIYAPQIVREIAKRLRLSLP